MESQRNRFPVADVLAVVVVIVILAGLGYLFNLGVSGELRGDRLVGQGIFNGLTKLEYGQVVSLGGTVTIVAERHSRGVNGEDTLIIIRDGNLVLTSMLTKRVVTNRAWRILARDTAFALGPELWTKLNRQPDPAEKPN